MILNEKSIEQQWPSMKNQYNMQWKAMKISNCLRQIDNFQLKINYILMEINEH